MYLYISPRWHCLVDIMEAHSRFLVHWSLDLTMLVDTVILTNKWQVLSLRDRQHIGTCWC